MDSIVYFEIAGPDAGALRDFYAGTFGWSIDANGSIAAGAGLRGGIRQDPPATVFYVGVDDINATMTDIASRGGVALIPRTVVPGVVTFALFRDPAGNVVGLAERGTYPG